MNPYDFVRFGKPGPRESAATHEHFKGHSGRITCRLSARTHLFIPKTQEVSRGQHARLELMRGMDGVSLLPGSSLKGVIRSVAEAISGSCMVLPRPRRSKNNKDRDKVDYRGRPPVSYQVPRDFQHCKDTKLLCPACRVFGFLNGEPFLGKVVLSDVRAIGEIETEWLTIEALMEPKPRHQAWYGDPKQQSVMRGRKFYYHRPLGPHTTSNKTQYNKTVETVRPGAVFEFSVEYTNLTDDELALLIFALVLEPEMCHKVGMGKPVGMGSAKIEIVRWEQMDREARYQQLGDGTNSLEGEAMAAEIKQWRDRYHEQYADQQDSVADLCRIWRWDPAMKEDVGYPSREWFRRNPNALLDEAP